ncbi:multiple monosaccharide ABC transporter substrate-binding protein [Streptomyces sp. DSM 40750]|uniref:multiple monosaccharide ABC transporter substrate-binding protein n=1 Tax=Streptomyces sp. DSM 40750 TaxID=2801030 RepID=UPI00214C13E6|nr:multiple monosaccharide ABC transporter substrate-binding protein [Streptomyces sp. DSM 40750]UUU21806.1 sugar ABC transporter substrate-binding protein [Streptomyces sp. DSM 40750]
MRNRRAALASIATAASLALTLSACGQSSEGGSETDSSGSTKGATIGIAMPTKSSERWISDGKNVVENLEAKGYKTQLVYGEDQPETQVSQIENLIAQDVKALIIAAIDNKSLDNVLQQAKEANIPVISYDRLILGSENVDYYASFDNSKVGELQANYIVEKLGLKEGKGPFNIELFAGSNDDNNTKYFFNGAMSVLKPYIDDKKLVVQSKQTELTQVTTLRWDGATAQGRMDDILTASYKSEKVDAVLSPYDGISIGILSALKSDGYGSKSKPLPVLTGQDAELASVKSIIAGQQTQTVYKDLRELAKVTSNMVDAVLNDKKVETNDTETYDNGAKVVPAYLLEPVSVDKANYEKVLVDGGYYTADQLK